MRSQVIGLSSKDKGRSLTEAPPARRKPTVTKAEYVASLSRFNAAATQQALRSQRKSTKYQAESNNTPESSTGVNSDHSVVSLHSTSEDSDESELPDVQTAFAAPATQQSLRSRRKTAKYGAKSTYMPESRKKAKSNHSVISLHSSSEDSEEAQFPDIQMAAPADKDHPRQHGSSDHTGVTIEHQMDFMPTIAVGKNVEAKRTFHKIAHTKSCGAAGSSSNPMGPTKQSTSSVHSTTASDIGPAILSRRNTSTLSEQIGNESAQPLNINSSFEKVMAAPGVYLYVDKATRRITRRVVQTNSDIKAAASSPSSARQSTSFIPRTKTSENSPVLSRVAQSNDTSREGTTSPTRKTTLALPNTKASSHRSSSSLKSTLPVSSKTSILPPEPASQTVSDVYASQLLSSQQLVDSSMIVDELSEVSALLDSRGVNTNEFNVLQTANLPTQVKKKSTRAQLNKRSGNSKNQRRPPDRYRNQSGLPTLETKASPGSKDAIMMDPGTSQAVSDVLLSQDAGPRAEARAEEMGQTTGEHSRHHTARRSRNDVLSRSPVKTRSYKKQDTSTIRDDGQVSEKMYAGILE
jgi:hypothetical protein